MTPLKVRTMREMEEMKVAFLKNKVPMEMLVLNIVLALVYFVILAFWFPISNKILFYLLIAGQVFHMWQTFSYIYTVWNTEYLPESDPNYKPGVDVFITVCGEPLDILEETLKAAVAMEYPNFRVYVLNDGYVAKKDNWREVEELAAKYNASCVTRTKPGGAKAGNINHALGVTYNPFVAVFDTDHIPHKDFLSKTVGYFTDPKMAYVQTPQFYRNYALNDVTTGAWEQQTIFYGPICKGKSRLNSVTMCGTNMVIRRTAIEDVGGMCEDSITEDLITGVWMHSRGWKSCYIPEVLAEGLAPEDFLSYYKQQYRWARGSMDVIFKQNIFFRKGLTLAQRIQYLSAVSFFMSGIVVFLNAMIPVIFFFTGQVPFEISTMSLAAIFLPYIFITIYIIGITTNFSFTFKSLAFAMAGFTIHIKALWGSITNKKASFTVTPKTMQTGNHLNLVVPHIIYTLLVLVGVGYAFYRGQDSLPSLMTNFAWALLNVVIFSEFIRAAMPNSIREPVPTITRIERKSGRPVAS